MRLDELTTFTIPVSWFGATDFSGMVHRELLALRKAVDVKGVDPNDLEAVKQVWKTIRSKDISRKPYAVRDWIPSRR